MIRRLRDFFARSSGFSRNSPDWLKPELRAIALGLFAFLVGAISLHAHDPYESFTTIIVHPDRMELSIGMAQSTALRLIDPEVKIPALTPENMAVHRPRLVREGKLLLILTSLGKQLVPLKVEVELTDENDIIFNVTYPRAAPGRLLIHAAYLKKLGDGYGGIVNVDDDKNRSLGWDQLLWQRPSFETTIPAAAATPPKK